MKKSDGYISKKLLALLHVAGWVLWLSLPFFRFFQHGEKRFKGLMRTGSNPPPGMPENFREIILVGDLFQTAILIGVFYFNLYLLRSGFGRKGKIFNYFLVLLGTLVFFLGANHLFRWAQFPSVPPPLIMWFSIFDFTFIIVVSIAYHLLQERIERQQQQKLLENENLKTELAFLRSQISPHFFFNVLNNMVAMARFQSPKLEPMLMRLSGIMRYMVYESNSGKVSLQKEIEYLESYIDLQELRFSDSLLVVRRMEWVTDQVLIEPMLLIPFVENAFKHGQLSGGQGLIEIHLALHGHEMHFSVSNRIGRVHDQEREGSSGIGLANVKRRLELLYPNQYQLFISQTDEVFTVGLQIQLV